jgi:O-antigen ligase
VVTLLLSLTSIPDRLFSSNAVSIESRREMWSTTARAAADFLPFGSGIGSFRRVYFTYENPSEVGRTIVNNAHNDYLEITLEAGLLGLALALALIFWWFRRVRGLWGPTGRDRFAMAAAVASGALLLHSLVDYPLRMPALSAIMAACLALLASSFRGQSKLQDLWSTRHVTI